MVHTAPWDKNQIKPWEKYPNPISRVTAFLEMRCVISVYLLFLKTPEIKTHSATGLWLNNSNLQYVLGTALQYTYFHRQSQISQRCLKDCIRWWCTANLTNKHLWAMRIACSLKHIAYRLVLSNKVLAICSQHSVSLLSMQSCLLRRRRSLVGGFFSVRSS